MKTKWAGKIKVLKRIQFIVIALVIFLPLYTYGEELIRIYVLPEKTRARVGEEIKITAIIETKEAKNPGKPQFNPLPPFKIISIQSMKEVSLSIVNGKKKKIKKYIYIYRIKASEEGRFLLGPIWIVYKGQKYSTDPIEIEISKKVSGEKYMYDDEVTINSEDIRKKFSLTADINKTEGYTGEQFFLIYKILSPYEIKNVSIQKYPGVSGFYTIPIYNPAKLKYKSIVTGGKKLSEAYLRKVVLYPLYTGTFKIEPLVIKATLLIKSKEFPDFFATPYTGTFKTREIKIRVKGLPPYNGNNFSGLVGSTDIEVMQSKKLVNSGETAKFYITIKSYGNISYLKDYNFKKKKDCKIFLSNIYDDRGEDSQRGVYFIRKFEYTVIPEEAGDLEISPAELVYFDPKAHSYRKIIPPVIHFTVYRSNNKDETHPYGINSAYFGKNFLIVVLLATAAVVVILLLYIFTKMRKNKNKGTNSSVVKPGGNIIPANMFKAPNIKGKAVEKNKYKIEFSPEISYKIDNMISEVEKSIEEKRYSRALNLTLEIIKKALSTALKKEIILSSKTIEKLDIPDDQKNVIIESITRLNKLRYSPDPGAEEIENTIECVIKNIKRLFDLY